MTKVDATGRQPESVYVRVVHGEFSPCFISFSAMPKRCIAANCSNVASGKVRLYRFPRDKLFSDKWSVQVRRTRADWVAPSKHSVLCSEHFAEECFDKSASLRDAMGFGSNNARDLLPDAVLALFSRKPLQTPAPARSSKAVEKRERKKVSFDSCHNGNCLTCKLYFAERDTV